MRDGQVEDQAPAARLVPKVVADLQVAAPLACACRHPVLRADRVSVQPCRTGGQGQIPSSRAPWLHMSELCRFWCGRHESPCSVFCSRTCIQHWLNGHHVDDFNRRWQLVGPETLNTIHLETSCVLFQGLGEGEGQLLLLLDMR